MRIRTVFIGREVLKLLATAHEALINEIALLDA
jgi:hypothetical protein